MRTGLSTSTVHRLLATLEKRRFVHFDRYESKWHVGAQSFSVGATFARRCNFAAFGRRRMTVVLGGVMPPIAETVR